VCLRKYTLLRLKTFENVPEVKTIRHTLYILSLYKRNFRQKRIHGVQPVLNSFPPLATKTR